MWKCALTLHLGWLAVVCGCRETGTMLAAVRAGTGAGGASGAAGTFAAVAAGTGAATLAGPTGTGGTLAAPGGAGSSAAGAAAVGGIGAGTAGDSSGAIGSGGAAVSVAGSSGVGSAGGEAATERATFARVWEQVMLAKGCTVSYCHGQGQAQGALSMGNKADAYKNLVGVSAAGPACQASGKVRVKPADPGASLLLDKLSRALPSCGETMPIGVKLAPACLSTAPTVCTTDAELSLVKDWIMSGAMND